MFLPRIGVVVAMAMLMFSALTGCQDTMRSSSHMESAPQRAVVVTGENGGGTTVYLSSSDSGQVQVMSSMGSETCPKCKADAMKYFQTGELTPKCSMCGATRTAVMLNAPSTGSHN